MKNGRRFWSSCLRTTLAERRFNSIGHTLALRSARPTSSPSKWAERITSGMGADSDTVTFWSGLKNSTGRCNFSLKNSRM